MNRERKRMKCHIGARSAGSQNSDTRLPTYKVGEIEFLAGQLISSIKLYKSLVDSSRSLLSKSQNWQCCSLLKAIQQSPQCPSWSNSSAWMFQVRKQGAQHTKVAPSWFDFHLCLQTNFSLQSSPSCVNPTCWPWSLVTWVLVPTAHYQPWLHYKRCMAFNEQVTETLFASILPSVRGAQSNINSCVYWESSTS